MKGDYTEEEATDILDVFVEHFQLTKHYTLLERPTSKTLMP